jgi:hypothetical protein
MKASKQRPNIVSVHLSPEAKAGLDNVCANRGMSIKTLLGRLICWFVELDRTEQSIVLGQVEEADVKSLAQMISQRARRPRSASPAKKRTRARRSRGKA